MDVRVRFVFNISTGEVEEFLVDDIGSRLPREDHNHKHDLVSAEIGHVIDKNPRVSEVRGAIPPDEFPDPARGKEQKG